MGSARRPNSPRAAGRARRAAGRFRIPGSLSFRGAGQQPDRIRFLLYSAGANLLMVRDYLESIEPALILQSPDPAVLDSSMAALVTLRGQKGDRMISRDAIELRGVRVHNLKSVDLDLQRGGLFVFCGVSGSGKTSLALDTLYAEGQRRYIESFSAYTRQFLERLDKPEAESIEGLPPAIAVTRTQPSLSSRSTVGTATDTVEYMRLLFSKIAKPVCPRCEAKISVDQPASIMEEIADFPASHRLMVTAPMLGTTPEQWTTRAGELREQGFSRAIRNGQTHELWELEKQFESEAACEAEDRETSDGGEVVIDRLTTAQLSSPRLLESLESAMRVSDGQCAILLEQKEDAANGHAKAAWRLPTNVEVEQRTWLRFRFSGALQCDVCDYQLPSPEPRLFSFNSPLGACPRCEGFGSVFVPDMELIVPDPLKSIREGAIAPWTSKSYRKELDSLLNVADALGVDVDIPFRDLNEGQVAKIKEGLPDEGYVGLDGFFAWLEKRAFKTHHRAFLSRWRSDRCCPSCNGARLREEARAFRIEGNSINELCQFEIGQAFKFFDSLELEPSDALIARDLCRQIEARLEFLCQVGLAYLTLDRSLRTLSGGEAQRVALTSALGSTLVNMLYILDEPTVGLHAVDVERLEQSIRALRDRGNTVIVVEHEPVLIEAADQVIEIGPGAGDSGGTVVFQGTPEELLQSGESGTADFLNGHRGASLPTQRRTPTHGKIRLTGARGNNLKDISVEFPLGLLCLVTGVSGAGKSSLVQDTLYGALCRRKRKDAPLTLPFKDVIGDGQIEDVVLVDQSPIGRTPRSNPVTYIKAFDDIRAVFAETLEARTRNLTASHFSFNVDGGRCTKCQGDGYLSIDMQFLADVYMRCPQCKGTRYRREILDVTYRGMNIAEVLDMTVRKAFAFFRGQVKLQAKLKRLIDVGLDYLKLGQPATTLSSGEAQRLKLASFTGTRKQQRTLFLLDEPTTGLHFSDIVKLIDCFEALLSVGHSLIVIEHNLQLMKAADYLIDMGPGAASEGGEVVATGSPEEIAANPDSLTGRQLQPILEAARHE